MSLESNVGKISHHEFFISSRGTESPNPAACGEQLSQTAAPKQGCGHLCRVVVRKLHFADYATLGWISILNNAKLVRVIYKASTQKVTIR